MSVSQMSTLCSTPSAASRVPVPVSDTCSRSLFPSIFFLVLAQIVAAIHPSFPLLQAYRFKEAAPKHEAQDESERNLQMKQNNRGGHRWAYSPAMLAVLTQQVSHSLEKVSLCWPHQFLHLCTGSSMKHAEWPYWEGTLPTKEETLLQK